MPSVSKGTSDNYRNYLMEWFWLVFGDAEMLSTQSYPSAEAPFLVRPCVVLSLRLSPRFKPLSITKSEPEPWNGSPALVVLGSTISKRPPFLTRFGSGL